MIPSAQTAAPQVQVPAVVGFYVPEVHKAEYMPMQACSSNSCPACAMYDVAGEGGYRKERRVGAGGRRGLSSMSFH